MTKHWSELIVVDPAIRDRGVEVLSVRLASGNEPAVEDEYRYEFSAAMCKTAKRWPRGAYWILLFDELGTLMTRSRSDIVTTADASIRQLTASVYAPAATSVELVFESETDADSANWERLQFTANEVSANAFGLVLKSARAESHDDFEFSNLTIVEFRGRVQSCDDVAGLSDKLWGQVAVFDDEGDVIGVKQIDLSAGPGTSRVFNSSVQVYRHQVPSCVEIDFFDL